MRLLMFLCILLALKCKIQCHRILGVFPIPSRSHAILGSALMKALAERGHEVTMISNYPEKRPIKSYTDIALEIPDVIKEFQTNTFDLRERNIVDMLKWVQQVVIHSSNGTVSNPKVQQLLHSNSTFDLVILQLFLNDGLVGFAEHFNCPLVLFSNIASSEMSNDLAYNPSPYSYVYSPFLYFAGKLAFLERVLNTAVLTSLYVIKYTFHYPYQNLVLQNQFNTTKTIWDIINEKAPLILLNSHVSIGQPVPHVPSMIEIGGFHVAKLKPLPKDLQQYLDNASEGVIYFSMGSNLKSSQLPIAKRNILLKVFAKLPQNILWKWEDDNLPDPPPNVKLEKWFPQPEILAHPNVKAFITHGGLGSSLESLYHGVPMVAIPIFLDQKMNTASAVLNGYAIKVDYDTFSEETLMLALKEIISNPIYRENVQKRSRLIKDQPVPPMDAAIFWVEHVIKYGGAHHLQVAASRLCWYQYYLLDVMAFLITAFVATVAVFAYCIKKIFHKREKCISHKIKSS